MDNVIAEKKQDKCYSRQFIIFIVPFIMFSALVLAYFNILPIKAEAHSIIIVGMILLIFIFFIKHNAWVSFCKFENNYDNIILNVEEYLEKNKFSVADQVKSYGSLDSFFDMHIKSVRNDNFANVAPSAFPTLGILGTFIAIAISMPDFSVSSQEALDKEITLLLSGVGTAFYASIYGIFLSLWWIFFEKIGLTKMQMKIDQSKAFYKQKLWSKEDMEMVFVIESRIQNEKILNKFEQTVTPGFIDKLNEVAQSKLEAIEYLNNTQYKLEERIKERYEDVFKLFDKSIEQLNKIHYTFEEEAKHRYKEVFNLFDKSIEQLNKAHYTFEEEAKLRYEDIAKLFDKSSEELNKIHYNFEEDMQHRYKEVFALFDKSSEELNKIHYNFEEDMQHRYKEVFALFDKSSEKYNNLLAEFGKLIISTNDINTNIKDNSIELKNSSEEMKNLLINVNNTSAEMRELLNGIIHGSEYNDKINKSIEQTLNTVNNFYEKVNKISEYTSSTESKFSDALKDQGRFMNAFKSEVYGILSSFEMVSSDFRALGEQLLEEKSKEERH